MNLKKFSALNYCPNLVFKYIVYCCNLQKYIVIHFLSILVRQKHILIPFFVV